MDEESYRMVLFDQFCPTCKNSYKDGNDCPCDACLSEPINLYSEKPIMYESDEEEK